MQTPATGGVRFAPSPTGRFHVGNFRTAWISWHLAQKFKFPWIVRYEDIDQPRVLIGAREQQRSDLESIGLKANCEFLQTDFRSRHWELFERAIITKQIYPCDCSRKDVQAALSSMASAPHSVTATYSGRCRSLDDREFEG
jgi:glutamyl-tRNA synthetase